MKTTHAHPANAKDSLPSTMRISGFVMILFSAFLLVKNVSFGMGDDIFCAFSLGLGAFAFAASWLPNQ